MFTAMVYDEEAVERTASIIDLRANKDKPITASDIFRGLNFFNPMSAPTPSKAALKIWPRWMSLQEATEYISLSDKTLLQLIADGKIHAKNIGRKWLLDRESIDAFMKSSEAFVEETLGRLREVVR